MRDIDTHNHGLVPIDEAKTSIVDKVVNPAHLLESFVDNRRGVLPWLAYSKPYHPLGLTGIKLRVAALPWHNHTVLSEEVAWVLPGANIDHRYIRKLARVSGVEFLELQSQPRP